MVSVWWVTIKQGNHAACIVLEIHNTLDVPDGPILIAYQASEQTESKHITIHCNIKRTTKRCMITNHARMGPTHASRSAEQS